MSELRHYPATRAVHLDHEQLLLLQGRSGARIGVIYRGVWLSAGKDPSIGETGVESSGQVRGSWWRRLVAPIRRRWSGR